MWPYIAEYAEGILREQVEHAIQMSSQELRSFRFSSIDLGDTPPRIGSVKVYSQQKKDEIHMDLELKYV
ncbi:unnamed protein product [Lymnaea stagnalis]|uniref:SMP-LTD domain-containing protein n=1 Tax=Lymnaea stagnalis TaxID=6523 RepID=A0AAV2IL34_LYMST